MTTFNSDYFKDKDATLSKILKKENISFEFIEQAIILKVDNDYQDEILYFKLDNSFNIFTNENSQSIFSGINYKQKLSFQYLSSPEIRFFCKKIIHMIIDYKKEMQNKNTSFS